MRSGLCCRDRGRSEPLISVIRAAKKKKRGRLTAHFHLRPALFDRSTVCARVRSPVRREILAPHMRRRSCHHIYINAYWKCHHLVSNVPTRNAADTRKERAKKKKKYRRNLKSRREDAVSRSFSRQHEVLGRIKTHDINVTGFAK